MPRHYRDPSKVKEKERGAPKRLNRRAPASPSPTNGSDASPADSYQDIITELERTITALRERLDFLLQDRTRTRHGRDYFHTLFEHTPAAYVVHDGRGYIRDSNWAAIALLGLKPRKEFTASLTQFVLKEDLANWLEHLRRCAGTRQLRTVELSLRNQRGRTLPVRLLTQPWVELHEHRTDSFHTLILDITERRATEAALHQTQTDYLRLIDAIEGIVWAADAHTLDVTFVSQHAERLLGYPASEWQRPGFWLNRIHHADRERVANQVLRAVEQRGDLRTEYRVLTAERQLLWLHDSITVVDQGGRLKLLGVAVDMTEQRKAQEQLRETQGLLERRVQERTAELSRTVAELEGFSYSISHDLRAPLRAMMGFAELAVNAGGDQLPPHSREFMERVILGAQRADRLVQDLLSYSRVSRANFKLEPVDLDKLVRDILSQSPQFQPPQAEVHLKSPLLPVMGHEVSLSQSLINLLSNATKFVPRGKVPRVRIWTEPVDGQVRLWVQDNGIGIEPQHLGRIFGIFERVHSYEQFEGTGIGLAIVRKGVERMGGSVGVESTPGKGSAFWIQLKAAEPAERTSA